MLIHRTLVFICVCSYATTCSAAAVTLANTSGETPFAITRVSANSLTFSIVLQIANAGPDVTASIWQLELELRPEPTSVGSLEFTRVFTPQMSLFGELPGPISDLTGSDVHINLFDGDLLGSGQPIPQGEVRNIVGLDLSAEPGSSGTFQLVMPEFNPDTPTQGSSLLLFNEFEPISFDNDSPSGFKGYILLGSITLAEVPEPAAAELLLIAALFGFGLSRARRNSVSPYDFRTLLNIPANSMQISPTRTWPFKSFGETCPNGKALE